MSSYRLLVEFFSDACSDDARGFAVLSPADEAFVAATIAEIDERICAIPKDAPHALRVLAKQSRDLWEMKR